MQDRRALAKAQVVEEAKEANRFTTPEARGQAQDRRRNRPVVNPSKVDGHVGGRIRERFAGLGQRQCPGRRQCLRQCERLGR